MRMLFLPIAVMVFLTASAHAGRVLQFPVAKSAPYKPVHLDRMNTDGDIWVEGDIDQEMEFAFANYNLHIKLLSRTGEYFVVGDVSVKDVNGEELLRTAIRGPLYLINLNPGTYEIAIIRDNDVKTQTVTLNTTGQKEIIFRWDE